jgi:hypothetical protein
MIVVTVIRTGLVVQICADESYLKQHENMWRECCLFWKVILPRPMVEDFVSFYIVGRWRPGSNYTASVLNFSAVQLTACFC